MIKVVSTDEMRSIEAAANAAGIGYGTMMNMAGNAVARVVIDIIGPETANKKVCVLVGKGNNGGDGLVAATYLHQTTGAKVTCYLLESRDSERDLEFASAIQSGLHMQMAENDTQWMRLEELLADCDVLIDAVLGTGTRLPVRGMAKTMLEKINAILQQRRNRSQNCSSVTGLTSKNSATHRSLPFVVAVDCPSGLDCDTGQIDPSAVNADITVTFGGAKQGHFKFPGAKSVGELFVADIGIAHIEQLKSIRLNIIDGSMAREWLPTRSADSHKGTYGRLLIVAGSKHYVGAAMLAGMAAYRVGGGLVCIAAPLHVQTALAGMLREAIWLPLPDEDGNISGQASEVVLSRLSEYDTILLGPGLGTASTTADFVGSVVSKLAVPVPVASLNPAKAYCVIDADGLNHLAQINEWWLRLPSQTVLTPHPGEMARLCATTTAEVQSNRLEIASNMAVKWNSVVVLKGAFTVVASPAGDTSIIPFATDALAKAGSGDVLSGCISGLLAQGLSPYHAAAAGAWVHSKSGAISAELSSSRSVIATDILNNLGHVLGSLDRG